MAIHPDAYKDYEQIAIDVLRNNICQPVQKTGAAVASGNELGHDLVASVREALMQKKAELMRAQQAIDIYLSGFRIIDVAQLQAQETDAAYVRLDIGALVAEVKAFLPSKIEAQVLPKETMALIGEYLEKAEFEGACMPVVEAISANAADDKEWVLEQRNLGQETLRAVIVDIRNGAVPKFDENRKHALRGLHTIEGLEESLKGITTPQLDLVLTFLGEYCPSLRTLEFVEAPFALGLIYKLCTLRELHTVSFSSCGIDNEMVGILAQNMKSLRSLTLQHCPGLTDLALTANAEHLSALTHLRITATYGSPLSDVTATAIATHMRNLHTLALNRCSDQFTHQSVSLLAQSLTQLEHLELTHNEGLTDVAFTTPNTKGVTNAALLKNLKTLDLTGCGALTDRTLHAIASNMPALTSLGLPVGATLAPATAATLGTKLKELREVLVMNFLFNLPIEGVVKLMEHGKKIESLKFYHCRNIDKLLSELSPHLAQLRSLDLSNCSDALTGFCGTKETSHRAGALRGLRHLEAKSVYFNEIVFDACMMHLHQLEYLHIEVGCTGGDDGQGRRARLKQRFPFLKVTK